MDAYFAEGAITPLADPQQPSLASRRVLFGHQPDPGGKLPAVVEHPGITHGRQERRGGERANPWNGLQALADGMGVRQRLQFLLVIRDFLVKPPELGIELVEQFLAQRRQVRLLGLERVHERLAKLRHPLGDHNPLLR